jgi:LmbE family N-acetylglucosaminyl deacetylase
LNQQQAAVDFLCITPHTDDAEIGLGGTLRLLANRGRSVWVCDLTRGELASNATPDERWAEAAVASQLLGLAGRIQLNLSDGFIAAGDPAQIGAVTSIIRLLRPRWVATAPDARRHPDHVATLPLVTKAVFMAQLANYQPERPEMRIWPGDGALPTEPESDSQTTSGAGAPWRCEALFETCPVGEQPSLIFDCSQTWPSKHDAIAAYPSQFNRTGERRSTMINDRAWLAKIDRRGQYWGFKAGVAHGEALRSQAVPRLGDLPEEPWS